MPPEDQSPSPYPATPAMRPISPEEEAELRALMQMEQGGGGTLAAGQPWNVDEPLKAKPTSQPRLDYTPAEPAPQAEKPPSAVPHDLDWKAAAPDPERNALVVADRVTNMNDPEGAFDELGKNLNLDSLHELNEWNKAINEGRPVEDKPKPNPPLLPRRASPSESETVDQKEPPAAKISGIPPAFMGPVEPGQKRVSESDMQAHLANILNHAKVSDFDAGGKYRDQRYVETANGPVDLKHIVASGTPFSAGTILPVTAAWETVQGLNKNYRQSAFASEDLRSNAIGASASDKSWPEWMSGKTFGDEAARHIGKMGFSSLPYGR